MYRPIDIFCYGLQYRNTLRKENRKNGNLANHENKSNEKKSDLYKAAQMKEANQRIFFQLVESFTENAPQLLLQLYILAIKFSTSSTDFNRESKFLILYRLV